MKKTLLDVSPFPLQVSLLCLGLSFSAGAAAAEGDPLTLTFGQSFIRDDNVFRLTDDSAAVAQLGTSNRADWISRTFAELVFDRKVGRQQFLANAGVNHNRYDRFSVLNFNGYNLGAGWLWELGERWRGRLEAEKKRDLAKFAEFRTAAKALSTITRANGNAEYRLDPDWSILVGAGRQEQDYSSPLLFPAEYRNNIVEVGVLNKRFAGNEFGVSLRRTDSNYPNPSNVGGRLVDDSFTQDDLLLNVKWQVTGKSILIGYVGYSRRSFDDVTERDFNSPTARLEYDWLVDPKVSLNATARRELRTVADVVPSSTETRALSVGPVWKPTAKITLEGKAEYGKNDFRGDSEVVLLGLAPRKDTFWGLSLNCAYKPLRTVQLSLSAEHERRDSNRAANSYTSNVVVATAQISF